MSRGHWDVFAALVVSSATTWYRLRMDEVASLWQDPQVRTLVFAISVGGLIFGVRKLFPSAFDALPKRAQAYPAMVLGAIIGSASSDATLADPLAVGFDALLGLIEFGVLAIGGHHTLKRLRGATSKATPRLDRVAAMALVVSLAAPALQGCGGGFGQKLHDAADNLLPLIKQWGPAVVRGAQNLCAGAHVDTAGMAPEEAEERIANARDTVCNTVEAVTPFLEPALGAQRAGAARAGLAVD